MRQSKTLLFSAALASAAVLAVVATRSPSHAADPGAARDLTVVNIEYKGSKVWVPATLILKKGEKVRLTLINNAPSGVHGYAIDAFGVKTVVANGQKKVVEFTADKTGLFESYCQLHPAHVKGQVLVIE